MQPALQQRIPDDVNAAAKSELAVTAEIRNRRLVFYFVAASSILITSLTALIVFFPGGVFGKFSSDVIKLGIGILGPLIAFLLGYYFGSERRQAPRERGVE